MAWYDKEDEKPQGFFGIIGNSLQRSANAAVANMDSGNSNFGIGDIVGGIPGSMAHNMDVHNGVRNGIVYDRNGRRRF